MRRTVAIGGFSWSRADLERVIERGEALEMTTIGVISFADDVTPDLIDRAIVRFRHRGPVRAPRAVQKALKRKEAKPV